MIKFQSLGGKIDTVLLNPTTEQQEKITQFREKITKQLRTEQEINRLSDKRHILELEEGKNEIDDDFEEPIDKNTNHNDNVQQSVSQEDLVNE
jgi:hypothetical protein